MQQDRQNDTRMDVIAPSNRGRGARQRIMIASVALAGVMLLGGFGQPRLGEALSGLAQLFSPGALERSQVAAVRPFLAEGRSEADWLSDADLDWRVQRAKLNDPAASNQTCHDGLSELGNSAQPPQSVTLDRIDTKGNLDLPRAL